MTQSLGTQPLVPITELEQPSFCRPKDESLKSRTLAQELTPAVRWQKIPNEYLHVNPEDLDRRIASARDQLGTRLVILSHHYQRDEIIRFSDFRGDSLELSRRAASRQDTDYILFCGVHFMAETADILTQQNQAVILPNLAAGCSMADMAPNDDVMDCWDILNDIIGHEGLVPVTYMNSTATLKALCGKNGGIACTSSNIANIFRWAFDRGKRVLFFPDQNLGRNTGIKLGIPLDQMVVWNPFKPQGGLSEDQILNSRIILWRGHCSVHTRFKVEQITQARSKYPNLRVIVHPECTMEVVEAADDDGSTEKIVDEVRKSPPGSVWAIGTEINLVNRLANENADKTIFCLDPIVCPCSTMYRIHPSYLCWVLEELIQGNIINRITVDPETRQYARIALERMLQAT
jgi:quinolinate synthase